MNATQLDIRITRTARTSVLIVALDAAVPVQVPAADILVVAPAVNSWLRRWVSDEDQARRRAESRVAEWLGELDRGGVHAEGRVGDSDPLQAIEDALTTFPADAILIAAEPGSSSRPADELVRRASQRFAVPTTRVGTPLARAA